MDAKQFGAFVAACRKERSLTQAQLAEKLHVTDKAVSRWERGLGFPDIATIEPLAEALNITITELMRSQKLPETSLTPQESDSLISDTLLLADGQRAAERRAILRVMLISAFILLLLFLIDSLTPIGFIGVFLPAACLISGAALFIYACFRKRRGLGSRQTFIIALLLLSVPLIFTVLLFLAGLSGLGPVPQ